jgi:predicted Zn-dependent protease
MRNIEASVWIFSALPRGVRVSRHDTVNGMDAARRFEALLASGKDSALLRFSLGMQYLAGQEPARAAGHLRRAVEQDPGYSAAWKLLGKALAESGDTAGAIMAYRDGIAAAERKGDKQAGKEMAVFLKRLEKAQGGAG